MRGSVLALAMVVVFARRAAAQERQRWQFESRIETLISRSTATHAVVGVNALAGTYLRAGVLAAAGARHVAGEWRASGRADLIGRFHVDPRREFSRGLYVSGGATVLFDDGVRPRVRAVVGVGVEGRSLGSGWIVGAEGGVGGGVRLALTLKRARNGAR